MTQSKKIWFFAYTALVTLAFAQTVNAMHIMEGFLQPIWCVAWGVLCLPFIIKGIKKTNEIIKENQQAIILLAMAGAFTFVLSALKIPSVTGSSSHMTGLGFAAIMFGPFVACVLGLIVLLFQALLLAHGGLTTLGANVFSMGIVGPILAFFIYTSLKNTGINKKVIIFLAAALGDLATYVTTSVQLALAFPSEVGGFMASFAKFASIFAVTQVPLAIMEGILTVVLINMIVSYGKDLFQSIGKGVLVYE